MLNNVAKEFKMVSEGKEFDRNLVTINESEIISLKNEISFLQNQLEIRDSIIDELGGDKVDQAVNRINTIYQKGSKITYSELVKIIGNMGGIVHNKKSPYESIEKCNRIIDKCLNDDIDYTDDIDF